MATAKAPRGDAGSVSVTITSPKLDPVPPYCLAYETFDLHGRAVGAALIRTLRPAFDPASQAHRDLVLLRVQGFSCNYRDRYITLESAASAAAAGTSRPFQGIGSDFVAEVEAVGAAVETLKPGDRVIPDDSFPSPPPARSGIPTDRASSRFLLLPANKVAAIPDEIDTATAACFTVGAQTAYGMVRRLDLKRGERVLVTAAHSNTSLFVCGALQSHDVEVYATASSDRHRAELKALGVRAVLVTPRDGEDRWAEVRAFAEASGDFDAIVDPFYDLNMRRVLSVLAFGGRYITCGLQAQHEAMEGEAPGLAGDDLAVIMSHATMKNLRLMGNCLGEGADLRRAIDDCAAGRFKPVIDSSFPPTEMKAFFERSYDTKDRLGKVALVYEAGKRARHRKGD